MSDASMPHCKGCRQPEYLCECDEDTVYDLVHPETGSVVFSECTAEEVEHFTSGALHFLLPIPQLKE